MYTLNFPNGNVQTYSSSAELANAAKSFGGEAKHLGGKNYAFVPKKWLLFVIEGAGLFLPHSITVWI